MTIMMIVPV